MKRSSLVFMILATLATAACKKKEGDGGSSGGGASESKAESKAGPTKLPKLGLTIAAPGSITVGDAVMGEGHMLQGSGIGAMQIEITDKTQTLDEAKADADMYTPKNIQAETLPDGWALSFENTGGAGTNYWVDVRRAIDGKNYKCTTTGSDPKQAAAVLAACKSLAKG